VVLKRIILFVQQASSLQFLQLCKETREPIKGSTAESYRRIEAEEAQFTLQRGHNLTEGHLMEGKRSLEAFPLPCDLRCHLHKHKANGCPLAEVVESLLQLMHKEE
jgi:hypothetical protein